MKRPRVTLRGMLVAVAAASLLPGWLTFAMARASDPPDYEPPGGVSTFFLLVASSLACGAMLWREARRAARRSRAGESP